MSTRSEALAQVESFLERVPLYERTRNYDRVGHQNVSRLSYWIRYRVISEEEVVEAVRARYSFAVSQKFLQEILWRSYWKGWLEMRPSVWARYTDDVGRLSRENLQNAAYYAACEGRTALPFFNDWVRELIDTGYLHNHTRMWFASVWIFTLRLPWQLGATFMYHHLLDGDPASNTLSWRWVGGLHTAGKIYVARPENIATYSDNRWTPDPGDLNREPQPLPFDGSHDPTPLRTVSTTPPGDRGLVLIHDDDLSADFSSTFASSKLQYAVLDGVRVHQSERVNAHVRGLRNDAAKRTGARVVRSAEELTTYARRLGVTAIHSMLPPIGFEGSSLQQLAAELDTVGVPIVWHRRPWDERYMPLARGGFFRFWEEVRQGLQ
jgi:deoxyribodipyrimidine photo-lyase